MSKVIVQKFLVSGIAIRTTNANGQAAKDIGALWQRFWSDGIQLQIPDKVNADIYTVYTDYEKEHTGYYTALLGCAVSSAQQLPEGLTSVEINTEQYQKFVAKGKMPEAEVNTWMAIWNDAVLNQQRVYSTDFAVYGQKFDDTENAEVDIFIAVES